MVYSVFSKCNKYERRNPVETFDMSTYENCSNCRYYTNDRRCAYDMDFNFTIH